MQSSERPLGFVTAVRAIVSSTPFFTLACLTAAIALLITQPVSQVEEAEAASLSASGENFNHASVEPAPAPLANAAAGIAP